MERREFLRLCGSAGLGLAAPIALPPLLGAQSEPAPYDGPFYAVFNASGGWDTTYLMDPKGVNEINRLYRDGDILTQGAHKFDKQEVYASRVNVPDAPADSLYTIRAWRAVVTYLLRRPEFLYE